MDETLMPAPERDTAFEQFLTDGLNGWNDARPRQQQKTLGPSSLGGCREYIRATIAGDEELPERPRGLDGATIGTLVGDGLETIFSERLGAVSQQRVTLTLESLGLKVSGSLDLLFTDDNRVVDLKSKDGLDEVLREGPSLANMIQISAYVKALVQGGVLEEGAVGTLVYYDRSGRDKEFVAVTIPWEAVETFIILAEQRLGEVFDVLEAGSPEESRWTLRDQSPSLCFHTQCPFRMACWGGQEDWVPSAQISGQDELDRVNEYIEMRKAGKLHEERRYHARENLRGISGVAKIGDREWAVSWKGAEGRERIDVVPV